MRFIDKMPEPSEFIAWKSKANDNWQPSFSNFQNPEKRIVHDQLITEQKGVCCYCEYWIEQSNSHIEHLLPQKGSDARHDLQLDYENFLCSCGRPAKAIPMPTHCGNQKGERIIDVTPLQGDCHNRFTYSLAGVIKAANPSDKEATSTIQTLGLNDAMLIAMREEAMLFFLQETDSMDSEELTVYLTEYVATGYPFPSFMEALCQ